MLELIVDKYQHVSMIEHLLGYLELDEKEIRVYLLLNKMGPSVASTIARLTGIQRTSVYDVLNRLQQKKLILSYIQGQMEYYFIDDLKKLLSREKEKVQIAEQVISLLQNEQLGGEGKVRYCKGVENVKDFFLHMLNESGDDLVGWHDVEYFYKILGVDFEVQTMLSRNERKLSMRVMLLDSSFSRQYKKEDDRKCRQTKLLPKTHRLTSSCFFWQDQMYCFNVRDEIPRAIHITDKEIVETNRQMFEIMWSLFV